MSAHSIGFGFYLFASLLGKAWAGATLDLQDEEGKTESISVEGNKLKVEVISGAIAKDSTVIYDGDFQTLAVVSPAQKSFWKMNRPQLKSLLAKVKTIQKTLSYLPAEQRKTMLGVLLPVDPAYRQQIYDLLFPESQSQTHLVWEESGGRQRVADQNCRAFEERYGNKVDAHGCYISWGSKTLTKKDLAPIQKFKDLLVDAGLETSTKGLLSDLQRLPGFPGVWKQIRLTKIVRRTLASDVFLPPRGFSQKDSPAGVANL